MALRADARRIKTTSNAKRTKNVPAKICRLTSQLSGRAPTHHARWIDNHQNTSLSCAWHFIHNGPLQRKLDSLTEKARREEIAKDAGESGTYHH
jgi:hypothetical protein